MKLRKVLVVEDERTWQKQINRALAAHYEVQVASSAGEARQKLDQALAQNDPFQIITLDIRLKEQHDKSGETLLNYIKQNYPTLKCVVVSGTADTDQVRNYFKDFEVLDYVNKSSFDPKKFKQIIDSVFCLGDYYLVSELGRGAMGTVYRARHRQKGHWVALKVLNIPGNLSTESKKHWLKRFEQEAKAAQSLDHRYIVHIDEYVIGDSDKNPPFIVMEYIEGTTLTEKLKNQKKLPVEQVINLGCQLFDALAYAHKRKIVHRDIKPANLMLTADNELKLTDFGIAKILDSAEELTMAGEILGTNGYMPPEQWDDSKQTDHRVDIYAAGVVLYQALTGIPPHTNPYLGYSPPYASADSNSENQSDLEKVIFEGMITNLNNRYPNADMVYNLLTGL